MFILLSFAFISGLVTILAPCIWPLLPIILSSTTSGGKSKPLGITLGIITSFAFFTLSLSYIVKIIPFNVDALRIFAALIIAFMGAVLVIPKLNQLVEGAVSRLTGRLGKVTHQKGTGFISGFITGAALGLVWSPCAGPILATIAALAATQSVNTGVVLVTIVYVIGVGIPLFFFALAGTHIFTKSRFLSQYTGRIQQIFGVIMIVTSVAIITNYDKVIQVKLLDAFPSYSQFLFELEGNKDVKEQLDKLKNDELKITNPSDDEVSNEKKAAEFVGIANWINTNPLTMAELKGKVVLIDFWTYTCINCIRTLPHVTGWYEKYKNSGLVVVGVHTPEFEFEKNTKNVEGAIAQYKINYPVAQDNDYQTWRAYDNHYWPAKYLIDKDGVIRYTHFGEGKYEETDEKIQELLKETGVTVGETMLSLSQETPTERLTPETYLGNLRGDESVTFEGQWNRTDEYAESKKGSILTIPFHARKVFLVITPRGADSVEVFLDDKKSKMIKLDDARLYELVSLDEIGDHILKLKFNSDGTKVYAFTFG